MADGKLAEGQIVGIVSKEFDVSERMVWKDLRRIWMRWTKQDDAKVEVRRARALRSLERLRAAAEEKGDLNAAIRAIAEAAKIGGLVETAKAIAIAGAQASASAEVETVLNIYLGGILPTQATEDGDGACPACGRASGE